MVNYLKSAIAFGFLLVLVYSVIRQFRAWRRAQKWPSTEGVIESGKLEPVVSHGPAPVILPVFGFSYKVVGEYYGGRFALLPYTADPLAADLHFVEHMIGRKLQVNYDPAKPAVWFIANDLIDGCKVEQRVTRDWASFPPIE
jgi:hypothetical protein